MAKAQSADLEDDSVPNAELIYNLLKNLYK